jgi:flagellar biosynthesis/type III secretory pathway chaperone
MDYQEVMLSRDQKSGGREPLQDAGTAFQQLSSVLEREIECYRDLLETARDEQKAIIHGKLRELKLSIEAEENLIASSRALDEVRKNIVRLVAAEIGCDPTGLTLKDIIARADDEHRERLTGLRSRLRAVMKELEFINKGNAQLIKSSIDFINETMWILLKARSNEKDSTYDSKGTGRSNTGGRVLVDKLG